MKEEGKTYLEEGIAQLPVHQPAPELWHRLAQSLDQQQVQHQVNQFYQGMATGDFTGAHLAELFVYRSPMGVIRGRADFLEAIRSAKDQIKTIEVEDCLFDQGRICTRYVLYPHHGEPLPGSDWLTLANGKLVEVESHFDASRYFNQMTG